MPGYWYLTKVLYYDALSPGNQGDIEAPEKSSIVHNVTLTSQRRKTQENSSSDWTNIYFSMMLLAGETLHEREYLKHETQVAITDTHTGDLRHIEAWVYTCFGVICVVWTHNGVEESALLEALETSITMPTVGSMMPKTLWSPAIHLRRTGNLCSSLLARSRLRIGRSL